MRNLACAGFLFSRRLKRLSSKSIRHLIAPESDLVAGIWRELRTLEKRLIILAIIAIALSGSLGNSSAAIAQATVAPGATASNVGVEQLVEAYFTDIPIMVDIARCESHMRQYDKNGLVIRGEIDSNDVGVMQINERYHKDIATKLGLDLEKLTDNLVYARRLYEKQGSDPWVSSKKCWGPKAEVAAR